MCLLVLGFCCSHVTALGTLAVPWAAELGRSLGQFELVCVSQISSNVQLH